MSEDGRRSGCRRLGGTIPVGKQRRELTNDKKSFNLRTAAAKLEHTLFAHYKPGPGTDIKPA